MKVVDREVLARRLKVYVLTDHRLSRGRSDREVVEEAIRGGATAIQLRAKEISTREMWETGLEIRKVCRAAGVLFIVNDRLDVALAVDADGLHVGQDDLPASEARRLLGPDKVLGVSARSVEEALKAAEDGADYLGVGPVYPTGTKADAGAATGVEVVRDICRLVDLPVVGIGGIGPGNAPEVIAAGADGVSVISAVVAAEDIAEAAWALVRAVEGATT